jgi:hypothetical protein
MDTKTLGRWAHGCLFLSLAALADCGHEPPPAVDPTLSPALEARADTAAHDAMPNGQRIPAPLVGVGYEPGQGTDWSVPLVSGQCYVFGYAFDSGISRFSVYLWGPWNRRITAERNHGGDGVLKACAAQDGVYRLEGKIVSGAGHFVVVGYGSGSPAPTAVAPAATDVAPTAGLVAAPPAATLGGVIDRIAAGAAPGASRVGDVHDGIGDDSSWPVPLQAGTCYTFIGAGDANSVKALSLFLWDPHSARITENRSATEVATIGYCAAASGTYKVEAKVTRKPGPLGAYRVGVYGK